MPSTRIGWAVAHSIAQEGVFETLEKRRSDAVFQALRYSVTALQVAEAAPEAFFEAGQLGQAQNKPILRASPMRGRRSAWHACPVTDRRKAG
jgi:hypothetical protein